MSRQLSQVSLKFVHFIHVVEKHFLLLESQFLLDSASYLSRCSSESGAALSSENGVEIHIRLEAFDGRAETLDTLYWCSLLACTEEVQVSLVIDNLVNSLDGCWVCMLGGCLGKA